MVRDQHNEQSQETLSKLQWSLNQTDSLNSRLLLCSFTTRIPSHYLGSTVCALVEGMRMTTLLGFQLIDNLVEPGFIGRVINSYDLRIIRILPLMKGKKICYSFLKVFRFF